MSLFIPLIYYMRAYNKNQAILQIRFRENQKPHYSYKLGRDNIKDIPYPVGRIANAPTYNFKNEMHRAVATRKMHFHRPVGETLGIFFQGALHKKG